MPVPRSGVTSPFGLLRFAEEYRAAASVVMKSRDPTGHSNAAFMLIGQSIELSLKAYLLARGLPLKTLKSGPFGHNLEHLMQEALRRRIDCLVPLHEFHRQAISLVSPVYHSHEFRYIVTGTVTLPKWGFIHHAAAELTRCQHDWLLRRTIGKEGALKRIQERGRFG